MIFQSYDTQTGEYGRIEIEFKDLTQSTEWKKGDCLPVYEWQELLSLVKDGYCPDFFDLDEDVDVDQRKLRNACKAAFKKYGESNRVKKIHADWDEWFKSKYGDEGVGDCYGKSRNRGMVDVRIRIRPHVSDAKGKKRLGVYTG